MGHEIFREHFGIEQAFTEASVDTQARSIRNVVLIRAGRSANNRHYSDTVLRSAAAKFNEAHAYANHPRGTDSRDGRSVLDITGWYSNVRYDEARQALVADRHFTNTTVGNDAWALASQIVEGHAPKSLAGLSINAMGRGNVQEGVMVVESIDQVVSVDDVDVPAAGGAYVESAPSLLDATLAQMEYVELYERLPQQFVERFKKENKTVRKDAELTALQETVAQLTEANRALEAQIEQLRSTHDEALVAATEDARAETEMVRRELEVERLLSGIGFPKDWEADLRETLMAAERGEWRSILAREQKKARAAGHQPRVAVHGAGPTQVVESLPAPAPRPGDSLAHEHESPQEWFERIQKRS